MKVRAWMELLRISNAPTVVTNVLAGTAASALHPDAAVVPWRVGVVIVAALLLYGAGMVLNDAFDAQHDAARRPGRPIPSGRVARAAAFRFTWGAMTVAILLLVLVHWFVAVIGLVLAAVIVLYDRAHRRIPGSVAALLMALCRAMLVLLAAWGAFEDPLFVGSLASEVWIVAATIFACVALLTWLAQGEDGSGGAGQPLVAHLIPVVALGPIAMIWSAGVPSILALIVAASTAVLIVGWHIRTVGQLRSRPPVAIMGWLAGLCLIDTLVLAVLDQLALVVVAAACFVTTVLAHRRILGS